MKSISLFLIFSFSFGVIFSQEEMIYPIKKDTSWWFVNAKIQKRIEKRYDFINYFDNHGVAYFLRDNKYGFMDRAGNEIVPPVYSKAFHLTGDFYLIDSLDKKYVYASHQNLSLTYDWCKKLDNHWIYFKKDTNLYLFNDQWNSPKKLSSKTYIFHFDAFVGFSERTKKMVFSPKGVLLDSNISVLNTTSEYMYFIGPKSHQIIVKNRVNLLPVKVDYADFIADKFYFSVNKQLTLLDYSVGKIVFKTKGEQLLQFYSNYKVLDNELVGVISPKGELLAKVIYTSIDKAPTHAYYIVQKKEFFGILDAEFKERLKPIYSSVSPLGDFLVVQFTSIDRMSRGLVSLKSFETVLPCVYDELIVSDTIVKSWLNGQLSFSIINRNHTVRETIYFDKAIGINQRQRQLRPVNYDSRLLSLGWFLDTSYRKNSNLKGSIVNSWGFKRNDSLKIRPMFKTLKYMENTSMTFLPQIYFSAQSSYVNPFLENTLNLKNGFIGVFDVINHQTIQRIPNLKVYSIFEQDYQNRNFARVLTKDGFGLLFSDGTIKNVNFYSEAKNYAVKYAVDGELKDANFSSDFSNKFRELVLDYNRFSKVRLEFTKSYELVDAKWNYLTKDGKSIFQNGVDALEDYKLGTAIYRISNRFGIITTDSIVIPPVYHSIQRISELGDTLFLAGRSSIQKVYYDKEFRQLPLNGYEFKVAGEKNKLFKGEKNNLVIDENNHILGVTKASNFLKFDYLVEKINKEFVILNAQLEIVAKTKSKPIEFLTESTFITESKEVIGVVSLENDTLLPFHSRKIERVGNFIVAENNEEILIYNLEFQPLLKCKESEVLFDKTSGNIAIHHNNKVRIYSSEFKLIAKWKADKRLDIYHGGVLLSKNASVIYSEKGESIGAEQNNKSVQLKGLYVLVAQANGQVAVYDSYGKVCLDEKETHKKVAFHGDNKFSFYEKEKKQWVLIDITTGMVKRSSGKFVGDFNYDSLIVYQDKQGYFFLDDSLVDAFNSSFDFATPFKKSTAIVQKSKGFSMIDKEGKHIALPNKGKLTYLTENLIEEVQLPSYMIINSKGQSKLPASYSSIHVLDNGIIQAIQGDDIYYINLDGEPLFSSVKKELFVEK